MPPHDIEFELTRLSKSMPMRIKEGDPWYCSLFVRRVVSRKEGSPHTLRTEIHPCQWPPRQQRFSEFFGSPSKYYSSQDQNKEQIDQSEPVSLFGSQKRRQSTPLEVPQEIGSNTRKKSRKRPENASSYSIAMIIGQFKTKEEAHKCCRLWRYKTRAAIPRALYGVFISKKYRVNSFIDWEVLLDKKELDETTILQIQNVVVLMENVIAQK